MKISTAVRAGEALVPGGSREHYFMLTADRGAMVACVTGCAYLGSYPGEEATREKDRIYSLLRFGDGKIHTASHAITRRLYAAFPDLGRNVKHFSTLLKLAPLKLTAEELKVTSLFGFLTRMYGDPKNSVADLTALLERAGL